MDKVRKLTLKEEMFAQAVAKGDSYVDAYAKSYNTKSTDRQFLGVSGHAVAQRPKVAARIEELKKQISDSMVMEAKDVVRHLIEVALADPNELTRYRRLNCRYCNGKDHKYQWKNLAEYTHKLDEWHEAKAEHELRKGAKRFKVPMPEDDGGYGFRRTGAINPECPACEGEGIEDLYIADTGKLKGPARRLFAGAKRTRNGIEIMQRSQDNALKLLGDHFGIFKAVLDATINSTNTNTNHNVDYSQLSKETLRELLHALNSKPAA